MPVRSCLYRLVGALFHRTIQLAEKCKTQSPRQFTQTPLACRVSVNFFSPRASSLLPFLPPKRRAAAAPSAKRTRNKPSPPTTRRRWCRMEDPNGSVSHSERKPLSHVVSDCVERWFHDTFKQARAGDPAMMVLVAQMFHNGYGVAKNEQKVWRSCGPSIDLLASRALSY
jgi:hypothetical protein